LDALDVGVGIHGFPWMKCKREFTTFWMQFPYPRGHFNQPSQALVPASREHVWRALHKKDFQSICPFKKRLAAPIRMHGQGRQAGKKAGA
jgi:hypothetical protein